MELKLVMLRTLARGALRRYSGAPNVLKAPAGLTEEETLVFDKLAAALNPVHLQIQDLSGGCGQMYAVEVESAKFAGLSMVKQHRLVNDILKEDVARWHGLRIKTKAIV